MLSTDSLSFPRPWNQKHVDDQPDQFFTYDTTYPHLVRAALRTEMPGREVEVTNLGRRAVTISNVKNVGRDLLSWMSSDVAVLHHGIVDCWIRNVETLERRTTEEEYEAVLQEFLALRAEIAPELPVILIRILHTNERMLRSFPMQDEVIDRYNAIIDRIANETPGVHALSLASDGGDERTLVHEDGHHLSRAGHQRVAERLVAFILNVAGLQPQRQPMSEPISGDGR